MLYSEQPKYYRFPSKTSLLDYERDHQLYFPGPDQSFMSESHRHVGAISMTSKENHYRKEQNHFSV